MTDGNAGQQTEGRAEERGTVRLRQEGAQTGFANVALVTGTPEEIILNFGLNVMPPNQQGGVEIQLTQRMVMTYPCAKRLGIMLGNIIQRYESAHGVIDIGQPPPGARSEARG